ncbi:hypothetical protein MTR_2g079820 [Medicago truncatula]|uniref:Uncharacterized protein n=1 Tax=Medicago truncatula TaxID=3880 RepID=A0A072V9R2_MEDTR|nr:hypothetical protein MTR_2g079820 [Medicago truncatula]
MKIGKLKIEQARSKEVVAVYATKYLYKLCGQGQAKDLSSEPKETLRCQFQCI